MQFLLEMFWYYDKDIPCTLTINLQLTLSLKHFEDSIYLSSGTKWGWTPNTAQSGLFKLHHTNSPHTSSQNESNDSIHIKLCSLF